MSKTRSTLALVLLFLWTAAPALRCLVPGESLTAEEQACCKSMGGQCDNSSASEHPCCKRATSTTQPALATSHATVATSAQVVVSIPPVIQSLVEQGFASAWLVDPSPPPNHVEASSVLRI